MLAELKKCLVLLPAGMRWRWGALVPLLVLTGVLEAVGAAAVFGLIKVLTDPGRLEALPGASILLGRLPRHNDRGVVLVATIAATLLYVAKNGLVAATAYARSRCVEEATAATSTGRSW